MAIDTLPKLEGGADFPIGKEEANGLNVITNSNSWSDFYQNDPDALVTQSPNWAQSLIELENGEDASKVYEFAGGRSYMLPLIKKRNPLAIGRSYGSMPHSWGVGGLLGIDRPTPHEMKLIWDDLSQLPAALLRLRPNPFHNQLWLDSVPEHAIKLQRRSHILNLEGGFDFIWEKKFKSVTRRNVRKAEKSGLTVECSTSAENIEAFYELFKLSIKRWANFQNEPHFLANFRANRRDPIEKFQTIARNLGNQCRLLVARKDGRPAAAIMVLMGNNANYTRGVMDRDLAAPTRANDLLHRIAVESACQTGCRYYHMGETGNLESLAKFKSRFGAEEVRYNEFYLDNWRLYQAKESLKSVVKKVIRFKDA